MTQQQAYKLDIVYRSVVQKYSLLTSKRTFKSTTTPSKVILLISAPATESPSSTSAPVVVACVSCRMIGRAIVVGWVFLPARAHVH